MSGTQPKSTFIMGVHASYAQHKVRPKNDMVLVKEKHKLDNGEIVNRLRFFENYQRDFYVTKPKYRNHKSKKEWEKKQRLTRVKTTQANMLNAIAKTLNCRRGKLRTMARNPFLYGADVHVSTIILHRYLETYGDSELMPTVGVMDYEWDVEDSTPSIGTYLFEDELYITVRRDKLEKCGFTDTEFKRRMHEGYGCNVLTLLNKYYDDIDAKAQKKAIADGKDPDDFKRAERLLPKLHIEIVDLDLDVVRKLFKHTHTTMPDYLTFWNGISDLTVIMELCKEYMVDPADFMNDPMVPAEYRNCQLIKGPTETIDANGNKKPKKNSEQWHVLDNMASWQFIDIMCCYHSNRAHKPDLPSYAFDFVIPREIKLGKLRLVPELEILEQSDMKSWHRKMANEHILEYSLYALFDVIGPMLLERKSFEIRAQAYSNLTYHPIGDFKKNPRKLCNAQHFSFLNHGYVVGTTSDQMREELDDRIYSSADWIITLNSSYHDTLETPALADSNLPVLYIPSNDDGDLTSSYPSNQRLLNISKTTTVTELIATFNIPESIMREVGLNISSNGDNSIDFCHRVLGYPHLAGVLAKWDAQNDNVYSEEKEVVNG